MYELMAGRELGVAKTLESRRGCRANPFLSGSVKTLPVMPQNFLECDREQVFLMPPDPRDWLPEGHLAWFVLESVEEMDLSAFYAAYRRGRTWSGGV